METANGKREDQTGVFKARFAGSQDETDLQNPHAKHPFEPCAWRLAKSNVGPLRITLPRMLCCWILRFRISTYRVVDVTVTSVRATRALMFRLWGLHFRSPIVSRWGQNLLSLMPTSKLRPPSERCLFSISPTTTFYPFAQEDGGDWILCRLS
jgi:hypothetical protein